MLAREQKGELGGALGRNRRKRGSEWMEEEEEIRLCCGLNMDACRMRKLEDVRRCVPRRYTIIFLKISQ
jgi:hypothetical protein